MGEHFRDQAEKESFSPGARHRQPNDVEAISCRWLLLAALSISTVASAQGASKALAEGFNGIYLWGAVILCVPPSLVAITEFYTAQKSGRKSTALVVVAIWNILIAIVGFWLGGQDDDLAPSAIAGLICFLGGLGLLFLSSQLEEKTPSEKTNSNESPVENSPIKD